MVGPMGRRAAGVLVVATLLVAACTVSVATVPPVTGQASNAVNGPSPSPAPSLVPVASPSPSLAGGGGPSPEGSPTFNACKLLTNGEATAVNGGGYGDGVDHVVGAAQLCVWQSASNHSSLTVEVFVDPTAAFAEARFAALKGSLAKFHPADVSGVGDMAFIARSPSATTVSGGIYVLDGSKVFDVVYLGGSVPVDATLKLAASLALPGLP